MQEVRKLEEFKRTLEAGNPAGDWPFADDPEGRYLAFIDELDGQDIDWLFEHNAHLAPLKRIRQALKDVKSRFIQRDHALEMMVACALAQANMVFLGPPGTAKSLLVRSFAESLGIRSYVTPIDQESDVAEKVEKGGGSSQKRRFFEYLLTRYTTPEELFGGTDIEVLLKKGVFCRRTAGMLPQAEIAFLDEIFKANSAILNTLLSLINERLFYNMGRAFKVNLAFVVGASNETPDQGELGALYDRFPIRVPCLYVGERQMTPVLKAAHAFDCGRTLRSRGVIPRVACLNDVRFLSKVLLGGAFGGTELREDDVYQMFLRLFLAIRRNHGISDRTAAPLLRVCRALAMLDERNPTVLAYRHLRAMGYVANKFDEMPVLQRLVQAMVQEVEPEAVNLFQEPEAGLA